MKRLLTRFPRMKMQDDAMLGKPGKRIILEILLFGLVFLIASVIESIPMSIVSVVKVFSDGTIIALIEEMQNQILVSGSPDIETIVGLVQQIVDTVVSSVALPMLFFTVISTAAVMIYCTKIEKRPLSSLGLRRKNAVAEYLVGAVIGVGIFSAAVGICAATGSLSVTGTGKLALVPLFLLGYLLQGFSEEMMLRGFLMMSMQRKNGIAAAVFWNSMLFAMLHLGNVGIGLIAMVNLFLFGMFASLYFLRRGNIWGIAAIHSLWNFVQGNFWGIRVSGISNSDSVFVSEMKTDTFSKLINGGNFGLEGGLGVTVVLLIGIAVLVLIPSKKSEISEVVPQQPDPAAAE